MLYLNKLLQELKKDSKIFKNPEIVLKLGDLTDNEREIILKGCLINYYRG